MGTVYNFKKDLKSESDRPFRHVWLRENSAWLLYSTIGDIKGAFCRVCFSFKPTVHRGVQGEFIIKPFTKYKDFHACCRTHLSSQWHRESTTRVNDFLNAMKGNKTNVFEQANSRLRKQIENNRQKLKPIISIILFCATHDLSLRGKTSTSSIFHDIIHFQIEFGDTILQKHNLEHAGNAKYISPRIQNEFIQTCGKLITNKIVNLANAANAFSVIADETSDISGVEQLSFGIQFLNKHSNPLKIREDFLGFTPLDKLNAQSIATKILSFLNDCGLDLNKLNGHGYDGCSVMAGKEGGVSKLIYDKYPKALFFHCASHRLNLVINDLNKTTVIRNTPGTIKDLEVNGVR